MEKPRNCCLPEPCSGDSPEDIWEALMEEETERTSGIPEAGMPPQPAPPSSRERWERALFESFCFFWGRCHEVPKQEFVLKDIR